MLYLRMKTSLKMLDLYYLHYWTTVMWSDARVLLQDQSQTNKIWSWYCNTGLDLRSSGHGVQKFQGASRQQLRTTHWQTHKNVPVCLIQPHQCWRSAARDAESLFFCGSPTPELENLGLQTLTPAFKSPDSDSNSRTYCVTQWLCTSGWLKILNSSNKRWTTIVYRVFVVK